MTLSILVVDDEPYITDLVGTTLRYEGFDVQEAHDGREALAAATRSRPDLVLLDVMMPDLDGFEVTRRMRQAGIRVPIIFLTARDATDDKVAGLTVGADDYVTKPFSLEELVARVRAVLRRVHPEAKDGPLRFSDLILDEDTHEVWRAGTPVQLTATEFNLLRYLMNNPRRVLSKTQILEHVWQYDFGGEANAVETYISYLRKKIDSLGVPLIHTVRGVGYCLRSEAP
ncbi:MAG: response regulator transcription factor [Candidatus Dormibacteria bacterium]